MLKILIVDDDSKKIGSIIRTIREVMPEPNGVIDFCLDIDAARDKLFIGDYDLLILDIQLPFRITDTDVQTNGGVELLNDIRSMTELNLPKYIIGITSFDESKKEHQEDFEQALWPIIKYQPDLQNWRDQLKEKVLYLIELNRRIEERVPNISYNYDLAIITAVKVEHEAILALPFNWNKIAVSEDSTEYWCGEYIKGDIPYKIIHASQHQMGMIAAATLTMKLIDNFRPRFLVMTGILAGYKEQNIGFGDIVIASESWDFGSGKIKEASENSYLFEPDPHQLPIEVDLKEKFLRDYNMDLAAIYIRYNHPKPQTVLKSHVGPVASGAAVIQNQSYVDEFIRNHHRKLLGIDMETYGVYYAAINAKKPRPTVFSIKSVCDFADSKKNDDYQAYASYTSAQFMFHFVFNVLF